MKKFIFFLAGLCLAQQSGAQVLNPGFEQQLPDRTSHWGNTTIQIFQIDSSCVYQGLDSMSHITREAHTGNYAYQLAVATACGAGYSGSIRSMRYDADTGFLDQRLPIAQRPAGFTFYYKMYAVQGDQGYAEAVIEDLGGGQIGSGHLKLPLATTWRQATIPMQYFSADPQGYLRISFRITSDSSMHYGSRFLVDDIGTTGAAGIGEPGRMANTLACYPVPATAELNLRAGRELPNGTVANISIMDAAGRVVWQTTRQSGASGTWQLPVQDLATGYYCIRLVAGDYTANGRFTR